MGWIKDPKKDEAFSAAHSALARACLLASLGLHFYKMRKLNYTGGPQGNGAVSGDTLGCYTGGWRAGGN